MAIGPVTLNGMIPRTQDFSTIKQQEDNKPFVEQQNIQMTMKTQEEHKSKQVNHADDANQHMKKYDAKEKGSNEYKGDKQKKKKKEEKESDKVVFRQEMGGFDMKI